MSKTDWPIDCISTLKQLVVESGKLGARLERANLLAGDICFSGQKAMHTERPVSLAR